MQPDHRHPAEYLLYPPRVADQVDVTEQVEGDTVRYIARNSLTSRYFLLKQPEYQVFRQIDGTQTVAEITQGGSSGEGPRVSKAALIKFLSKLDSLGLLARGGADEIAEQKTIQRGQYIRIPVFNPDRMLSWLNRKLRWALTSPSVTASFAFMVVVALALLSRATEASAYTSYTYSQYGLGAILVFTVAITVLHEFAHGLACKRFGGEVREVGVLMIYYVLPAFYCNVSDIHRFGRKSERLWVIFAGIYWQLLVSATGAALWLVATPHTLVADFAFLVMLGGTINILFNCNPLIKLDGYYALSQWMGIDNLQSRSSRYIRSIMNRLIDGPDSQKIARPTRNQHRPVLFIFYWAASLIYSVILIWLILVWAGAWLMDNLGLLGIFITLLLALLLTEKWWKPMLAAVWQSALSGKRIVEGVRSMSAQPAMENNEAARGKEIRSTRNWTLSRRQVIKITLALLVLAALIAPWEASTGSDCALLLPPGREGIVRANTDAVLSEIFVQPGDAVSEGTKLARLANPEIEDRLTQLNSEIERLTANASRLEDELRVRSEMLLSASFKQVDRKRLADELKRESEKIAASASVFDIKNLPASLGVLQSEIELRQTELEHNRREAQRYKKLYEQGLVGEQVYDRAVAAMRLSEKEVQGARVRLESALVDHRRAASGAETSSLVAETDARAARSSFEALIAELHANRQQLEAFRQRRDILQREYEGMNILATRAGVVLGEDLHKIAGRRFSRGEEIFRIGELEKFLLKINVSEREIARVRLDSPVRFKLKTVPDRTFTGRVSKISAEATPSELGQRFYPVEVVVDNSDGVLRPGMTGFARISFGRQSVGLILADKVWQSLRPELWLF